MSQIGFFGGSGGGGGGTLNTLTGNTGVATASGGNINVEGGIGSNITTTGSSNNLNISISGTTDHAVQVGNSTGSLTSVAVGTTGQVLTGVTGGSPTFQSPAASSISITGNSGGALTGNSFTFTGGTTGLLFSGASTTETLTGTLVVANGGTGDSSFTAYSVITGGTTSTGPLQNVSGVGTSGQVLTSNGAGALPSWQAGGSGGGFTWSVITANQTASVNNGYICNKASTLVLSLPATSAVGDIIRVTGINTALGWQIAQASGQQIFFGATQTTSGATGTLTSSAIRDAIEIVCIATDTTWQVLSSIGNITVA